MDPQIRAETAAACIRGRCGGLLIRELMPAAELRDVGVLSGRSVATQVSCSYLACAVPPLPHLARPQLLRPFLVTSMDSKLRKITWQILNVVLVLALFCVSSVSVQIRIIISRICVAHTSFTVHKREYQHFKEANHRNVLYLTKPNRKKNFFMLPRPNAEAFLISTKANTENFIF